MSPLAEELIGKLKSRTAHVAVIGLGYVGLPLVNALLGAGFRVLGVDIDGKKIAALEVGESYLSHVPTDVLTTAARRGRFKATKDYSQLQHADAILICVPTPLTKHREPDLSFVESTGAAIRQFLRQGQLIVLESTTYPGTTRGILKPSLESAGLLSGRDFFLAFSPEREDPGNPAYSAGTIPKIVGGDGAEAESIARTLYEAVAPKTVVVSSLETAEAVKLTENIFRAINIALVNELKVVFTEMAIDIWEVIEAAKTKPFGFMPFYPGPGLGGHCIPIDPFYLTWKAREYNLSTKFIELAGEINVSMPHYVVGRLSDELSRRFGRGLSGSRILIVGLAYKKNISDIRESPSLKLMEILSHKGASSEFHDPFVSSVPETREYSQFRGKKSVNLAASTISTFDAVVIATDHDAIDYCGLVSSAKLIVDTRNVCARSGIKSSHIIKA